MNLRMSLLSGAMVLALSVPAAAQYQATPVQPATPGTVTELAPGAMAPGMMASTQAHLNLRAGPGTEHSPIGVIPEGATVEILDCLPDRVWCEVAYGDMTGYASELYLETAMDFDFAMETAPGTAAALAPPAVDEGIAFAMTDLNLRAGAGMEHPAIAVIPEGASVMIHDCLPGRVWCEVSYGQVTGFASQRYLEIS